MLVSRWGGSLAVRLPKALVKELGLKAGDELDVVKAKGARIEVEKNKRAEEAIRRMALNPFTLPPDYKFDREEANSRK
ncbi:MAG: AbrB/MazE/SpoVT family DNA-binding domain-containing protein [Alphaproteobacteria bacterium]|nr:AbrB/MazE/SpoVT family DNA-binding domain-containing protein [Alphaproteobacteria bacterium]